MNVQNWLSLFIAFTLILRSLLLLALFWLGLRSIQKNKKIALFYILLFFFNLVMSFIFY